jgi:isopenicillin N synthase-like dioxygenase
MVIYTPPAPATRTPIIDISGADPPNAAARDRIAREIHVARRTIGFFYVVGDSVPRDLTERAFSASRAFCNLTLEARTISHMRKSPA